MRDYESVFELRGMHAGTAGVAGTWVSAPIDTRGFSTCLAVLTAGGVVGTATNVARLNVQFQECAIVSGTTTAWSDIDDGAINGTFDFDEMVLTAGTTHLAYDKHYERLSDGVRKRYIRATGTMTGTASVGYGYSLSILLGNPVSSDRYVSGGTSSGSLNPEFTKAQDLSA